MTSVSTNAKFPSKPMHEVRSFLTELQLFDFTVHTHRYHDISDNARDLSLTEAQSKMYVSCVGSIRKALNDVEGFTEKDIERLLEKAIFHVVFDALGTPQKRLQTSLKELEDQLVAPLPFWEVHQPVCGLYNEDLPVHFGKVTFYFGTNDVCQSLASGVDHILRTTQDTPKSRKVYKQFWKENIGREVKGKGFCRITVQAYSGDAAWDRALRELALTLDVINLFAAVSHLTGNGGRLYLPGEMHSTGGLSLSFRMPDSNVKRVKGVTQNAPMFHSSSYLAGPLSSFSMSKGARANLKFCGWERASQILLKSPKERTEMETRCLAAMRWAGKATFTELRDHLKKHNPLVAEQAFLLYAIALESLLLKKESELSYRLSLRGAHLLGQDAPARQQIQKQLVELYELRSKIVHSGSTAVSRKQLDALCVFAKQSIFYVLTKPPFRSMKTEKEFQAWFDARLIR